MFRGSITPSSEATRRGQMTVRGSFGASYPRRVVTDSVWPKIQYRCPRDLFILHPFSSCLMSMCNHGGNDRPYRAGENWRMIKLPCQGPRNKPPKKLRDEHEVQLIFRGWNRAIADRSGKCCYLYNHQAHVQCDENTLGHFTGSTALEKNAGDTGAPPRIIEV